MIVFTNEQAEAVRKFSKDTERVQTSRDPDKRVEAKQSLAQAEAALTPRQAAILKLAVIRGRPLTALAEQSGSAVVDLERLLQSAANDLVAHYQSREAA